MKYEHFVASLIKPMSERDNLAHMAMGLSGESGEVLDLVKKHFAYGKTLDRAKVIEEMGDVLFYFCGLCMALGVSIDEVMENNQAKLSKRFPSGYTDNAAIARVDVQQSP